METRRKHSPKCPTRAGAHRRPPDNDFIQNNNGEGEIVIPEQLKRTYRRIGGEKTAQDKATVIMEEIAHECEEISDEYNRAFDKPFKQYDPTMMIRMVMLGSISLCNIFLIVIPNIYHSKLVFIYKEQENKLPEAVIFAS